MSREPRRRWPASVENRGVPRLNEALSADDVAITFVNHATFLIQIDGTTILTDPHWSERASPFSFVGPRRVRRPGVAFQDLPAVDVILLSHNHYDHLDLPTLRNLRQRGSPIVLCAAGDRRLVGPLGFHDLRELDWWDDAPITGSSEDHLRAGPALLGTRPVRPAAQPMGRLCDREPRPPGLFRRRQRILHAFRRYQDAARCRPISRCSASALTSPAGS